MAANRPSGFKFSKLDSAGAPDAEFDDEFLHQCFVDTGDFSQLVDVKSSRVLLLGRTGTGKSALLRELGNQYGSQVINIKPETLALSQIGGSQILNFVASLNINLDPLFKLLWRHVFSVEVLRRYFEQHTPAQDKRRLLTWLQDLFGGETREDKESRQAIEYLREWGEIFWEETEYRVGEITKKI